MKTKLKKHELRIEKKLSMGECGNYYCTGHFEYKLRCKCGWTTTVSEGFDSEKVLLEHRLELAGV